MHVLTYWHFAKQYNGLRDTKFNLINMCHDGKKRSGFLNT